MKIEMLMGSNAYRPIVLTDVARSKIELVAENAFLRQQLLVLRCSVKRPQPTPRDRLVLVLFANMVRLGV